MHAFPAKPSLLNLLLNVAAKANEPVSWHRFSVGFSAGHCSILLCHRENELTSILKKVQYVWTIVVWNQRMIKNLIGYRLVNNGFLGLLKSSIKFQKVKPKSKLEVLLFRLLPFQVFVMLGFSTFVDYAQNGTTDVSSKRITV